MNINSQISKEKLIAIDNVSKYYPLWKSPGHQLLSLLLTGLRKILPFTRKIEEWHWQRYCTVFKALDGVSFEICRGESVGIIGINGSGKSTLLQIIAGTRLPTTGSVSVKGRIAALLELGSGFKPEFTGRENVYINGAILGLSKAEVKSKFSEIEAFAEIGDFIDRPVKTYSSGMLVRLVFAVQVALDPDILIIDEALAVGDVFFQQKCAKRMKELKERGTTLLFVSHNSQDVRSLCEKAVLLEHGKLKFYGSSLDATQHYFLEQGAAVKPSTVIENKTLSQEIRLSKPIWKSTERSDPLIISAIEIPDITQWKNAEFDIGKKLIINLEVTSQSLESQSFWMSINIKNSRDQLINSTVSKVNEPFKIGPQKRIIIVVAIDLNVEAGSYAISFSVGRHEFPNSWVLYDATDWLGPITTKWQFNTRPAPFHGAFGLPIEMNSQDSMA